MIHLTSISLAQLAGCCILSAELAASEGGRPVLDPYNYQLWVGFGGFDAIVAMPAAPTTYTVAEDGYLTYLYGVMNALGRARPIQVELGQIPSWSAFKRS